MNITYESICKKLGVSDINDIYKDMPNPKDMTEDSWKSPIDKLSLDEVLFIAKGNYLRRISI